MSVTVVPSSQQASKKKTTSRKRRQNQNEEIHELASLVPLSSSQAGSLVPGNGGKPQTISVLRLTTTFLKLQDFMKDASPVNSYGCENVSKSGLNLGRMEEAMDGFLIVLDKEANILYVSETTAGHVGLIQQDVIGQNLTDITHPEFAAEIRDSLKPSVILPTSVAEDITISQYRQFFVRMVPCVSYSTFPSHSIVLVRGNLKVKLSPSNITTKGSLEFVEPSVIGFIGKCRVVESVASILEISVPHSSFIITRSLDLEKIISVDATIKDVVGYDPEVILAPDLHIENFLHPADQNILAPMKQFLLQNGHVVSPHFRFLTSSSEWVWLQIEGKLRTKSGTSIPHFWEIKIRALSQWGGKLKYIEQRELYSSESDQQDNDAIMKFASTTSKYCTEDGTKPIIDSLKSTRMPESVLEPVLHGRSVAMNDFSELVKQMLSKNSNGTTSMQCEQTLPTASSELSPSSVAQCSFSAHSGSFTGSDVDTLSSHMSSAQISMLPQTNIPSPDTQPAMRLSTTPTLLDSGSVDNSPPQLMLVTDPVTQSHFTQQLQQESCSPILTVPNPLEQNGVLDSPLVYRSSIDSSPDSSTMMVIPHQQEFIPSPEQFLNFANPVEMCSPYNSTTSTDFSPHSSYPVDVDTMLHTASSTDSIPSATSVPFQNTNFIPQAPLNDFNPQIPESFNFSNNTTFPYQPPNAHSSLFISTSAGPSVPVPTTHDQAFDSSNLLTNSSDPLMHQLGAVGEMMGESNVDIMACLQDATANVDSVFSHSCPQNNFIPDSDCSAPLQDATLNTPAHLNVDFASCIVVNSQSSHFCSSSTFSSNSEVQDILQQFM